MKAPARGPVCLLIVLPLVAGCGAGAGSKPDEIAPNVKALVALYTSAMVTTGRPPRSREEFKQYIAERGGPILESHKIASPDELFVSPRDNQPYVVVYGPPPKGMAKGLVVYEQTGVDGKRQVGFDLGNAGEVDEAKFRELVPATAQPK